MTSVCTYAVSEFTCSSWKTRVLKEIVEVWIDILRGKKREIYPSASRSAAIRPSAFNLTLSAQFTMETGAMPRVCTLAQKSRWQSGVGANSYMQWYCARHAPSETDCAPASSINVNAGPVLIFQAPREFWNKTLAATHPRSTSHLMWVREVRVSERAACWDLPTVKNGICMKKKWRRTHGFINDS